MLYRRRWVILGVFLVISAVAGYLAYQAMQDRFYQTSSLVLVDVARIPVSVPTEVQDQTDFFARRGNTLSDEVLLLTVSEPLEQQAGQIMKTRLEEQGGPANYPVLLGGRPVQDLTPAQLGARGRRLVGWEPVPGATNVLRIVAKGPSALEVTLVANAFASAYEQITQRASLSKVTNTTNTIEDMVKQRLKELQEVEDKIRGYQAANPTASLNESGSMLNSQIIALEQQRDEAERSLAEQRATLQSLNEERAGIRQTLGDGTVNRLRDQRDAETTRLAAVKAQIDDINRFYADKPQKGAEQAQRLRPLNERRDELQASVDRLNEQYAAALFAKGGISNPEEAVNTAQQLNNRINEVQRGIRGLEASRDRLVRNIQDYKGQLGSLPGQQSELASMERERMLRETAYRDAVNQLRGNDLQQTSEGGYVQVIQAAEVPFAPAPSGAMNTLLLGAFLGLLAGIGLAFVLEMTSNLLYKQEDVEKLGVHVLDFIPHTDALNKKNRASRVSVGSQQVSAALVALFSPFGPYVEALRKVEASLGFAAPGGKTFLVTSSRPGEGKSVTTANLAILFARSGRRTLLIDADMRRPQVHDLFGLSNEKGLANLLSDADHVPAYEAIVDMGVENLRILPAGESSRVSTELLRAADLKELIDTLGEDYDMVLVDSPPVLAISDAEVLAPHVDAVVMMCRAGMTRSGELLSALESLRRARANVLGVALNGFKIAMAYGYRYRYGKYARKGYYGYGYDYAAETK